MQAKTFAFRIPPHCRPVFDALVGDKGQTDYTHANGWWRPKDLQTVAGKGQGMAVLDLMQSAPGLVEQKKGGAPAFRIHPEFTHMTLRNQRFENGSF